MSNSAWCDLNSKCDILKLHDKCPNPRCNCQKIITFTPHQNMLECRWVKSKLHRVFRGTKKACDSFLKPKSNATAPFIRMAVSAKTRNPRVGQTTTNILKSMSRGKIMSLTALHGKRLRLPVM